MDKFVLPNLKLIQPIRIFYIKGEGRICQIDMAESTQNSYIHKYSTWMFNWESDGLVTSQLEPEKEKIFMVHVQLKYVQGEQLSREGKGIKY